MSGQADYFSRLMQFNDENDLSAILPGKLFLSGRAVPQNPSLLIKNNITHVLSLTRMKVKTFDSVTYKWFDLDDLAHVDLHKHFDTAHKFIDEALAGEGACLVHCDAGVSRSSTMVISYIMRREKLSLVESFQFVRAKRSIISPNFGFIKQLLTFESALNPSANRMAFYIFYTRLTMFHNRPDITDEEIQEALLATELNVFQAIGMVERKKPFSGNQ